MASIKARRQWNHQRDFFKVNLQPDKKLFFINDSKINSFWDIKIKKKTWNGRNGPSLKGLLKCMSPEEDSDTRKVWHA